MAEYQTFYILEPNPWTIIMDTTDLHRYATQNSTFYW